MYIHYASLICESKTSNWLYIYISRTDFKTRVINNISFFILLSLEIQIWNNLSRPLLFYEWNIRLYTLIRQEEIVSRMALSYKPFVIIYYHARMYSILSAKMIPLMTEKKWKGRGQIRLSEFNDTCIHLANSNKISS